MDMRTRAHHDVAALRKVTTAEYFSAMKLPDAEVQEHATL